MALFTRRILQQLIYDNSHFLSEDQRQRHADAINRGGRESIATEWEIAVLNVLSKRFAITHEIHTGTTRPDVYARSLDSGGALFTADIATISEAGRNELNPIFALQKRLTQVVQSADLDPNRINIKVDGALQGKTGREVMQLHIPLKNGFDEFFRRYIDGFVRQCSAAPFERHELPITENGISVTITYDPNQRFSGMSCPAYDVSYSVTRNPLYNVIKRKIKQLGQADLRLPLGVIACAADTDLRDSSGSHKVTETINEAFREYSRLSFVLVLWAEDPWTGHPGIIGSKFYRNSAASRPLDETTSVKIANLRSLFPKPSNGGHNACYELDFLRWKRGRYFLGAYAMSQNEIRISVRTILDLLAGRTTLDEFLNSQGRDQGRVPAFETKLRLGQLLEEARVERVPDQDDDWLIFRFGSPDPAIAPLRAVPPPQNE